MIDPVSRRMKQIAVEWPALIAVFERRHLDFCWTGEKTPVQASAEIGVPSETVLSQLRLQLEETELEQPNWACATNR
ncbi:MAG: DUF542 domain-containing protein [Nitrospirota bacterium]